MVRTVTRVWCVYSLSSTLVGMWTMVCWSVWARSCPTCGSQLASQTRSPRRRTSWQPFMAWGQQAAQTSLLCMALITSCPRLQVSGYHLAAGQWVSPGCRSVGISWLQDSSFFVSQQAHVAVRAQFHVPPHSYLLEKTSIAYHPCLH